MATGIRGAGRLFPATYNAASDSFLELHPVSRYFDNLILTFYLEPCELLQSQLQAPVGDKLLVQGKSEIFSRGSEILLSDEQNSIPKVLLQAARRLSNIPGVSFVEIHYSTVWQLSNGCVPFLLRLGYSYSMYEADYQQPNAPDFLSDMSNRVEQCLRQKRSKVHSLD